MVAAPKVRPELIHEHLTLDGPRHVVHDVVGGLEAAVLLPECRAAALLFVVTLVRGGAGRPGLTLGRRF